MYTIKYINQLLNNHTKYIFLIQNNLYIKIFVNKNCKTNESDN